MLRVFISNKDISSISDVLSFLNTYLAEKTRLCFIAKV